MSDYKLGTFEFIRWEGVRPQFVVQHALPFRKAGQDGISVLRQGTNGNEFRVTLTAVFADETAARADESTYRSLIGTINQLIYETTDYRASYNHDYFVLDVVNTKANRCAMLCGPDYTYPGGWQVVSDWVLIPILYVDPG